MSEKWQQNAETLALDDIKKLKILVNHACYALSMYRTKEEKAKDIAKLKIGLEDFADLEHLSELLGS